MILNFILDAAGWLLGRKTARKVGRLVLAALALVGTCRAATLNVDDDLVESPQAQFRLIAEAIAAAAPGDRILIYPGLYREVLVLDKPLTLAGSDPLTPTMVAATIVDAANWGAVIRIMRGGEGSRIEGLCLLNGSSENGGAVQGDPTSEPIGEIIKASVLHCRIGASAASLRGGAVFNLSGTFEGNTIYGCQAYFGGAFASCRGTFTDNTLFENGAYFGGAFESCSGTFAGNAVYSCSADQGGVFATCSGTFQDNVFTDNWARLGGVIYQGGGDVIDNTFRDNNAEQQGGAVWRFPGLIRGNLFEQNKAAIGGAMWNSGTTVADNVFRENSATASGGALSACNARFSGNRFEGNRAKLSGGAMASGGGSFVLDRFEGNQSTRGGALADCQADLRQARFIGNRADLGGAISRGMLTMRNCLIESNVAVDGAAFDRPSGAFSNCTFALNVAPPASAALVLSGAAIVRNSLFYGNGAVAVRAVRAEDAAAANGAAGTLPLLLRNGFWGHGSAVAVIDDAGASDTVLTTAAELDADGRLGARNLDADPLFVLPAAGGDWHLGAGSPAIDLATLDIMAETPALDLDGNGRWAGAAPDLGSLEFAGASDQDGDGLTDEAELQLGTDPARPDTDGDGLGDGFERFRGTDPLGADPPGELHVPGDATSIQEALMLAFNGERIVVAPGRYREMLNFGGKSVHLTGSAPEDPSVTAATVIDAMRVGPAITLAGSEDARCVIEGLTLTHGLAPRGAAILGRRARAVLRHCLITSNTATAGGPVDDLDGTITLCRFTQNQGTTGGALFLCDGQIRGNTFELNFATDGGAINLSSGAIEDNVFEKNRALGKGGAMTGLDGPVRRNQVTSNTAVTGGAIHHATGPIEQNTFAGNKGSEGGALSQCGGRIQGNLIAGNTASSGGALHTCHGTVLDNVIRDNVVGVDGGGLFNCNGAVRGNLIEGNRAYACGAIGFARGRIEGNTIRNNSASALAGAIFGAGGELLNNEITGNHSTDGGGLMECGGRIEGNVIRDNRAAKLGGGALRCENLARNLIEANRASEGAGLYGCEGVIEGNRIQGNVAEVGGGALARTAGIIQNNLIQGNRAPRGAAFDGGPGLVRFNTILGNLAEGPAASVISGATGELSANLIAYNQGVAVDIPGTGISSNPVRFNLFFENSGGAARKGSVTAASVAEAQNRFGGWVANVEDDPRLVSWAGPDGDPLTFADNDARLAPDSAAIDIAPGPGGDQPVDLEGTSRPLPGHAGSLLPADAGAYELFGVQLLAPEGIVYAAPGEAVTVSWRTNLATAGNSLRFEWWRDGRLVRFAASDWHPQGESSLSLTVPADFAPGVYTLRAFSYKTPRLGAESPGWVLLRDSQATARGWWLLQ